MGSRRSSEWKFSALRTVCAHLCLLLGEQALCVHCPQPVGRQGLGGRSPFLSSTPLRTSTSPPDVLVTQFLDNYRHVRRAPGSLTAAALSATAGYIAGRIFEVTSPNNHLGSHAPPPCNVQPLAQTMTKICRMQSTSPECSAPFTPTTPCEVSVTKPS